MKLLAPFLAALALAIAPLSAKDVDIAVAELPAVITEAIKKSHPNATLISAEKDLKADGEVQHYEVKIRDGEKEKELKVKPDGTITSVEKD